MKELKVRMGCSSVREEYREACREGKREGEKGDGVGGEPSKKRGEHAFSPFDLRLPPTFLRAKGDFYLFLSRTDTVHEVRGSRAGELSRLLYSDLLEVDFSRRVDSFFLTRRNSSAHRRKTAKRP